MSRSFTHLFLVVALAGIGSVLLFQLRGGERAPVGIVIPHHDMVASARRAYLREVGRAVQPQTIVLLSPDHFGTNRYPLVVSSRVWQTSEGEYEPDQGLIEKLQVPQDAADFLREHGITGLLRDLKTNFPESRIVPVMVSQSAPYAAVEEFVADLYQNCPSCLMVASVDFSHSTEVHAAMVHDQLTLRELYKMSPEGLFAQAEVDSPQSLAALALWAGYHEAPHFNLFSHTNSGLLSGQRVGEMTTHIIGGYSAGQVVTTLKDTAFLMFGGDVMFARGVHATHVANPAAALTSGLGDRFFWGVDRAVVNLEGVFTGSSEYAEDWDALPPRLRFHPSFVKALTAANVDTVSLANNHSDDGGEADSRFTEDLLEREGVAVLKHSAETEPTVELVTVGKTKVALLGVATQGAMTDIAPVIIRYREAGYKVVLFAHWGNEYTEEPSSDQRAMAERWVEAGAVLIVGSHPHVIQKVDVYHGVPVVYSLGNLLFDQAESVHTKTGLVLAAEIDPKGVKLTTIPVGSYLRPQPVSDDVSSLLTEWKTYREDDQDQVFYFPF